MFLIKANPCGLCPPPKFTEMGRRWWMPCKAHSGDTSGVEEKRRVLSGRMNLVVVLEFCERQEPHPIVLSLVDEGSEILFQFLVDPFRLSITLQVVGGGGCQINSK